MDLICRAMIEWNVDALWIGRYWGIVGDCRWNRILKDLEDVLFGKLIRIDISNNCV